MTDIITIKERGKAPVFIDRAGELDIVERAFDGLAHITLPTKDISARTDALVALDDLTTYVVEVKDRDRTYAYIAERGPLVDTSKAQAVADKAREEDATGIIIWRTTDGFLIGADAEDILEYGVEDPAYQRQRGNRPQDREKSVMVLPLEYCYVRPPATVKPGRLERDWLRWLGSGSELQREEN